MITNVPINAAHADWTLAANWRKDNVADPGNFPGDDPLRVNDVAIIGRVGGNNSQVVIPANNAAIQLARLEIEDGSTLTSRRDVRASQGGKLEGNLNLGDRSFTVQGGTFTWISGSMANDGGETGGVVVAQGATLHMPVRGIQPGNFNPRLSLDSYLKVNGRVLIDGNAAARNELVLGGSAIAIGQTGKLEMLNVREYLVTGDGELRNLGSVEINRSAVRFDVGIINGSPIMQPAANFIINSCIVSFSGVQNTFTNDSGTLTLTGTVGQVGVPEVRGTAIFYDQGGPAGDVACAGFIQRSGTLALGLGSVTGKITVNGGTVRVGDFTAFYPPAGNAATPFGGFFLNGTFDFNSGTLAFYDHPSWTTSTFLSLGNNARLNINPQGTSVRLVTPVAPFRDAKIISRSTARPNVAGIHQPAYNPDVVREADETFSYYLRRVVGANVGPNAKDDVVVAHGGPITIDVVHNDIIPSGATIVSVSSPSAGGTANVVSGKVVYTPDALATVSEEQFTYTLDDGSGNSSTATVIADLAFNSGSSNSRPAAGSFAERLQGSTVILDAAAHAFDADWDILAFAATSIPTNGTVVYLGSGLFEYTSNGPSGFGADSFNYSVDDGMGGISEGTITIVASNSLPIAPDLVCVENNGIAVLDVLATALDSDGDALSVSFVGLANFGSAADMGGGVIAYSASGGALTSPDTFLYTISDGFGGSATGTITVYPSSLASIGNFVWEDFNRNGLQDSGEVGIPDVSVALIRSDGTFAASTATDAAGAYRFDGVLPGSYRIQVVAPAGYQSAVQFAGSSQGSDSDINASGFSDIFSVTLGDERNDIDAGFSTVASTQISMSSSNDLAEYGSSLTLTASVASGSSPVTQGLVSFYDGSVLLGSSILDSFGDATVSVSTLSINVHQLSAVYGGIAGLASSVAGISQRVLLTDNFDDGDFAGWTSSTFASPGSVTAANGRVEFSGSATSLSQGGIIHDVVADGDFEASADFIQNGADGSRWRHGIELTFANGRVVFHDADGADKGWYLYGAGNTPVWNGNPGNSAGIEGESTIKIRRTGDRFVFDAVRAGVESYLASYDFADLGDLVGVQSRAWAHDAVLDAATDNFRLVPISGGGMSPTESFTDDFTNGLAGWTASSDGTGGSVTASNGGAALQGAASGFTKAGIAKDVSVAGDFTFAADLAWLGSSGSWRQGIFVNFGSQSFLIHDSGEAGWFIYGPSGVLFAGNAGGTSGQSGTTTLSIERSGDTLTFGFTRGGTFTTLFTTTQTGLGTLTQVGLAAWSHGIDLNAFADNASLTVA